MNEVLRQEKKYLLTLEQYYKLSNYIGQLMYEDVHNKGDGYTIRSLYFDTLEDKDFCEKEAGVQLRRKIRLRNYGAQSKDAVLEMKQKQGQMQKKRSLRMAKEDASRLIHRDYGVLLKYSEDFALECYALMNSLCYIPKTIVEYKRRAFVAKENSIRVTFDHHLIGTESNFDVFSKDLLQYPLMNPYLVVLEIKFNGFLLSYIKDALHECGVGETTVSKYCLARAVSTHFHF
ncbi:MAG: polyphosphate polymerase domain-containing protein [Lachnospiraceae bacterium]|nr:polyphosphate polymerase domain-containing protein [Lachnospiraceae bacterium]